MLVLILGVALYAGVHFIKPMAPDLRARFIASLGEGGWRLIVAGLLILSIWLMVRGYGTADATPLWIAPDSMRFVAFLLMLPALMLFFATYPGAWIKSKIRHPQLTGFKLWAILHLIVNGDLPSVVLFGGMLAWAVIMVILINRRDGKPPLPAPSSNPVAAFAFIVVGLITWVLIYWAHGAVFGVYPLP